MPRKAETEGLSNKNKSFNKLQISFKIASYRVLKIGLSSLKGLISPLNVLIRPLMGIIRPLIGLIRSMHLIRPSMGLNNNGNKRKKHIQTP